MALSESRNIILVDDDLVTIQLCNMVFKRTIPNAKIFVFENGLEALEWIEDEDGARTQKDNFVLLLDLNMPVLNGWGFLKAFEKLDESIREKFSIHILTSSIDENDIEHSKQYESVKGFHSKPLTHKMIEKIFDDAAPAQS
ncbi:MAG TPA: response regulator [Chitinophagales bacterium]|nr:response regulator [Chitinophagales bacterium]